MSVSHPTAVIGEVVAAAAVSGWWLGAYETHVGAIVTTMAGVFYLYRFFVWVVRHWDNNYGD